MCNTYGDRHHHQQLAEVMKRCQIAEDHRKDLSLLENVLYLATQIIILYSGDSYVFLLYLLIQEAVEIKHNCNCNV